MRLIDADALLNILKREEKENDEYGLSQRADGITDAIMDIIDAPTIEPHKWTPIEEALPDKDGCYLVTGKKQSVYISIYKNGWWYGGAKPIAWMLRPEPWRGGQDETAQ